MSRTTAIATARDHKVHELRIFGLSEVSVALQREGFAKLASRAALLPWPGFSDHFPYGYVEALREELELQQYSK